MVARSDGHPHTFTGIANGTLSGRRNSGSRLDDVPSIGASQRRRPKYHLPELSIAASVAYNVVRKELLLDGNQRQNLTTFSTTWVEADLSVFWLVLPQTSLAGHFMRMLHGARLYFRVCLFLKNAQLY
jgi:hypothetical protein